MRIVLTTLVLTLVCFSGALASVQYWEQFWQPPSRGDWQSIGIVSTATDDAGKPTLSFATFTYVARDVVTPGAVSDVAIDASTLRFKGDFGERQQQDGSTSRVVVSFELKRSNDGAFEGPATLDGKDLGRTRLVKLDSPTKVLARLEQARTQVDVEIAICQGQIPPLRESVKFWLKQLDEDRRMGRATSGTQTALSLTVAEGALGTEESRLTGLELKRMAIIEALEKLKHAAP